MPYRCKGCRQYFRGTPFDRVGLSNVCSSDCGADVMERARRPRVIARRPGDIPPATRTAVLERDGGCRYCGIHVGLHLHHINYRSQGVDHDEHNLIALCYRHHQLVHSDKGLWQPVCKAYITGLYDTGRKRYLRDIERTMGRRANE